MSQVFAGRTSRAVRAVVGVCAHVARKRVFGHRTGGSQNLRGCRSRPHWLYGREFQPSTERSEISRRRWLTGKESVSKRFDRPPTVGGGPKRCGGDDPGVLEPAEPIQRNERGRRGGPSQIDTKQLSKFRGIMYRATSCPAGPGNVRDIPSRLGRRSRIQRRTFKPLSELQRL